MVLDKFAMQDAKPVSVPLASYFKFSSSQCPKTIAEKEKMATVPYANTMGRVCSRPDIAYYSVNVLSRFMANPGHDHWNGVKWLLRYIKGSLNMALIEYL